MRNRWNGLQSPVRAKRPHRRLTPEAVRLETRALMSVGTTTGGVVHAATPTDWPIAITSLSKHTFIATDTITLHARLSSPTPGVTVTWTVVGQGAAAGIGGFPTNVATTTDATGTATFSFRPSDDPTFVTNRRTQWTKGSTLPNPAISFDVTARVVIRGTTYADSLSDTKLGPLKQDEIDRLIEEYYDCNIPVPARDKVVPSLGGNFNTGNYQYQLSVGLDSKYSAVLSHYRGRTVRITFRGETYAETIPADATVSITSAYRDPQRNKAIGSRIPDSKHTRGKALDLVPQPLWFLIPYRGKEISRAVPTGELYKALDAAAATQGTAFAETGNAEVPLGSPGEDHIHVQW